jgi:hypothetical protein
MQTPHLTTRRVFKTVLCCQVQRGSLREVLLGLTCGACIQ